MSRLKNMVVYCVVSATSSVTRLKPFIDRLSQTFNKVYIIPTENCTKLIELPNLDNLKNVEIRNDYSNKKMDEEDLLIVAPCTFNTFNKMNLGIADNYALTIIASTIGKNIPIFVSLAMNRAMFNHPIIQKNIQNPISKSIYVIWPNSKANGETTMAEHEKIMDCILAKIERTKFKPIKENKNMRYQKNLQDNYVKLINAAKHAAKLGYVNEDRGCIALRTNNGFVVTASGAALSKLSSSDISLVTKSDSNNEKIHYYGEKAPSSETPLFSKIFETMPKINAIIHTHSKELTYSSKLKKYQSKYYVPYGTFSTFNPLKHSLIKNRFCIMKDHGEVSIGKNFEECFTNLKKMESINRAK